MIPLRIGSIILLVLAILVLSGIVDTAEAMVHADDASACCGNGSNEKESGPGPCSVPDCTCASCLTIDFPAFPTVSRAEAALIISFNPHRQIFHLSEFIRCIEYPPETC
jgi:hypothetical protein